MISILPNLWWLALWGMLIFISLILNLFYPELFRCFMTVALDDEIWDQIRYLAKGGVSIRGIYIVECSAADNR